MLRLNISKTKFIIINNHKDIPNINDDNGIQFNNELIERVEQLSYLGLLIDDKISWNAHINKIKNRIVPISIAIAKLKRVIPKKQLMMVYHAHFMSHIGYLNPIWNVCTKTKLDQLQRLQNRIVKCVENKPRLTPTISLYRDKPNINLFSFIQTATTIHKIKLNLIKHNLKLQTVGETQRSYLRNILNYRPKFFRTEKCKNSIMADGLKLYNSIPTELKNIQNINSFKAKIEQMYIGQF